MLKAETPFPHVGSFALYIDRNLPESQQKAELVRVMRRDTLEAKDGTELPVAAIAFPLRTGASGSCVILESELIDATALSAGEQAELDALRSKIAQQVRPSAKTICRAEALRTRSIYSGVMRFERKTLERLQAKGQPSIGRPLPRSEQGIAA